MIRVQVTTSTLSVLYALDVEVTESDHLEKLECASVWRTEITEDVRV